MTIQQGSTHPPILAASQGPAANDHMSGSGQGKVDDVRFRLLLIDPSALSRSCFVAALEGDHDIHVMGLADVDEVTPAQLEALQPHVIALRVAGEGLSDDQLKQRLERLAALFPPAQTMLLARSESPDQLLIAMRMGLGGFITTDLGLEATIKAMEILLDGLAVFSYGTFQGLHRLLDTLAPRPRKASPLSVVPSAPMVTLTARQHEVLQLLIDGLSNKAIAYRLRISESTVKVHIRAIMERTGAISRTQIIARYFNDRK